MPAPTSISVTVDREEYSRYEKDSDTITVSVTVSGGATYASEEVTVELVKARRSRDAVVASTTLTFNGATDPQTADAQFYLPDVVDSDLISLIRHGDYFVRATSVTDPAIQGESSDFKIRIVTVERFKRDYLFGIPLTATGVKMPKFQPNISGISIKEVNRDHPEGFGTLTYNYHQDGPNTIRTLSWDGGTSVSITSPGTYLLRSGVSQGGPAAKLRNAQSTNYVVVRVGAIAQLPTESAVEEILIKEKELDDDTLGRYLDQSIDWIENVYLPGVYLEPTNVVTDRDPTTIQYAAGVAASTPIFTDTDYDFLVSPLTYFVENSTPSWVKIQTPYKQLLRVDSLYGAIANTRVIDIDLEWIELSQQGGLIQLVPFNQEIAFDFIGLIWVNAIRGAVELPNFWHFNIIAGLRDCPDELQELLAKRAAIEALTSLSAAFRPGVGSLSLSRDGVSESVSYINQQQYGIYTAAIQSHKEWMDQNQEKLRAKYTGMLWDVV